MRKFIVLLLAAALLGLGACATADEVADGRVVRVDWVDSRITLDVGGTFEVPDRYYLNRLETGDRVAVSYVVENGRQVATRIWAPARLF